MTSFQDYSKLVIIFLHVKKRQPTFFLMEALKCHLILPGLLSHKQSYVRHDGLPCL